MNITELRSLFPHLQSGRIYFNHASTGPLSLKTIEQINYFVSERSVNNIDDYKNYLKVYEETRNLLASYLNASPGRIAFADNTSNGINILAQGITWNKGDRVLLNDIEFPANVYPFLNLKNDGVFVDFVKSNDHIVSAEQIIDNIKPETKLISVSFVQFLSGYKIGLEKIGKVCKEKGIIFCVDAIQGLGALRLDVEKYNIDFLSCGTQKWMLGMQGLSFIFITKNLQEQLHQKYLGWLSVENAWNLLDYNVKPRRGAEGLQSGTLNTLGIYVLNASLKLFKEFGFDKVEENVINNSVYFIDGLRRIGKKPILSSDEKKYLSGIVSFEHPGAQKILDEISRYKIDFAVREGIVRFSPHFYNTKEDIDKVLDRLKSFS